MPVVLSIGHAGRLLHARSSALPPVPQEHDGGYSVKERLILASLCQKYSILSLPPDLSLEIAQRGICHDDPFVATWVGLDNPSLSYICVTDKHAKGADHG